MTMPGGPIIIIDPLKAFIARFDFNHVWHRISTWLSVINTSSLAGLAAYALLDHGAKAAFPMWALATLGSAAVGSAVLTPFATSFKQKPAD
jgi:hypothetical protein